jgi:hypothetical protein
MGHSGNPTDGDPVPFCDGVFDFNMNIRKGSAERAVSFLEPFEANRMVQVGKAVTLAFPVE